MRIARIWGSRRMRQLAGRLLSLHQAEVRFDRFLDSVACIIATQWLRRRAVLLYGQLHSVCNRIRGFDPVWPVGNTVDLLSAPKALPEVRGFRATHNSTFLCRVLMNYISVMDQYSRRIIGFAVDAATVDGVALCRMFNRAIRWQLEMPKYLSTDHHPLYRFHQWVANLRVLEVTEIKTVPYVPLSHPFVERLIWTLRRECLDRTLFRTAADLEAKLLDFQHYYNEYRTHVGRKGHSPVTGVNADRSLANLSCYRWQKHCRGLYQTPMALILVIRRGHRKHCLPSKFGLSAVATVFSKNKRKGEGADGCKRNRKKPRRSGFLPEALASAEVAGLLARFLAVAVAFTS